MVYDFSVFADRRSTVVNYNGIIRKTRKEDLL